MEGLGRAGRHRNLLRIVLMRHSRNAAVTNLKSPRILCLWVAHPRHSLFEARDPGSTDCSCAALRESFRVTSTIRVWLSMGSRSGHRFPDTRRSCSKWGAHTTKVLNATANLATADGSQLRHCATPLGAREIQPGPARGAGQCSPSRNPPSIPRSKQATVGPSVTPTVLTFEVLFVPNHCLPLRHCEFIPGHTQDQGV